MMYSKILGTGGYLPKTIFTNADWEKRVETSDAWIVERTGIHSRHIAAENETASSMAVAAATRALESAGKKASDIQMIIVATGTPDFVFPATACLVQQKLAIENCIAFDIQAACTGFIYALSIANQYIQSGSIQNALVIGTEVMSRVIDWTDRNTCVLFGDGTGAIVLGASSTPGVLSTDLYSQGNYADLLFLEHKSFIKMEGRKVFKIATTKLGEMVQKALTDHQLAIQDIHWFVPHQANIRIIQATAEKLGIPMEKVICTVATHSNTSSASIPLALDVAVRDGRVQRGQTLLLEAFGGGLTWGSALVKY